MVKVFMPKFGLIMTEGPISEWYKKAGDHVTAGEPLVQVETQKLVNDVESPVSGTLVRILAEPGETVPCHGYIAEIEQD